MKLVFDKVKKIGFYYQLAFIFAIVCNFLTSPAYGSELNETTLTQADKSKVSINLNGQALDNDISSHINDKISKMQ